MYDPVSPKEYAAMCKKEADQILSAVGAKAKAAGVPFTAVQAIAAAPWEAILAAAKTEMRRDRDGVAWPPRRVGASYRQRNSKGTDSFQAAGDRRALKLHPQEAESCPRSCIRDAHAPGMRRSFHVKCALCR